MARSPKTGRELEPERGHKGPGVISALRSWGEELAGHNSDSDSESE